MNRWLETDTQKTARSIINVLNESAAGMVKKEINKDKPEEAPKEEKVALEKRVTKAVIKGKKPESKNAKMPEKTAKKVVKEELEPETEKSIEDQIADLQDYLDNTPEIAEDEKEAIQAEIDGLISQLGEKEVDNKATKKLDEKELLTETGEWDDDDDEMSTWLEDLRTQATALANNINGQVKSVSGIDKYMGPMAVIKTPKHGDIEMFFDSEDDTGRTFVIPNINGGFLRGDINYLSDVLNQDSIVADEIINESEKLEEAVDTSEEFFGYSLEDDIEEYEGPVPFDRFLQRAIDFGVEDEVFEKYGNRSRTNVNKLVKEYYKDYEAKMNQAMKDNSLQEASFNDKVSAIKKSLKKRDKRLSDKTAEQSAKNIAGAMAKKESMKEEYSEKFGGDPKDFISDLISVKYQLSKLNLDSFGSHLARQMVEDFIDTCDRQIEKAKRLASGDEFYTEANYLSPTRKEEPLDLVAYEPEITSIDEVKDKYVKIRGDFHKVINVKPEGDKFVISFAAGTGTAIGGEFEPATLDEIKRLQLYTENK